MDAHCLNLALWYDNVSLKPKAISQCTLNSWNYHTHIMDWGSSSAIHWLDCQLDWSNFYMMILSKYEWDHNKTVLVMPHVKAQKQKKMKVNKDIKPRSVTYECLFFFTMCENEWFYHDVPISWQNPSFPSATAIWSKPLFMLCVLPLGRLLWHHLIITKQFIAP